MSKTSDKSKHAIAKKTWLNGKSIQKADDPLAIECIDHLEIYVDNARMAAFYLMNGFGFLPIAYRGPETGTRDLASYVLKSGDATLVVTCPLRPTSEIGFSVMTHGITTRDIAFQVPNCEAFYQAAMSRGAESVHDPILLEDDSGSVKRAAIKTYGNVIHSVIERTNYKGPFLPEYAKYPSYFSQPIIGTAPSISFIDHVVGNVELGKMDFWVNFYEKVLGFSQLKHFSDEDISTEYSALMSKVMKNGSGKIKLPINEPANGKRKSQIEEYLDFHCGPGVQHIALRTNNIIATVEALRQRGVGFLRVPKTYYDEVPKRVGTIKEDLKRIAELGILADRDDDGYLLQLFTKPIHDRPTLFFELIQREGSQGFGVGNFKALFESIEREQALRGNL